MIPWLKQNQWNLILALTLTLAFVLHFRNLEGVVYLDEDEARSFALLSSGPLMFLMGSPIYALFRAQSAVFYIAATAGFLSIVLFYLLCRLIFEDKRLCVYAAIFYALWPLRLNYARTLFPSVYIEFYFLLAFIFLSLSLKKGRPWLSFFSGVFSSAVLFTHSFGYAMIAGLLTSIGTYFLLEEGLIHALKRAPRYIFFYGTGFLITTLAVEYFFRIAYGYSCIEKLMPFGAIAFQWAKRLSFSTILRGMYSSNVSAALFIFLLVILFYAGVRAFIEKKKPWLFFFTPCIIGAGGFLAAGFLKVHTVYERHLVWPGLFFCAAAADIYLGLRVSNERSIKIGALVLLGTIWGAFLYMDLKITEQTFKVTPIRLWLRERHIENNEIATSWWQINARGDRNATRHIPTVVGERTKEEPGFWMYVDGGKLQYLRYEIVWPLLYALYKTGQVKYLISSGISLRESLGKYDAVLKQTKPIKVWPHPYTSMTLRPYCHTKDSEIALYRLEDIFNSKV